MKVGLGERRGVARRQHAQTLREYDEHMVYGLP